MTRLLIAAAALCGLCAAGLALLGYFGALFIPIAAEPTPLRPPARIAAVVLSGDMGFNTSMARKTGVRLARDGIPVVGVNSLAYFKTKRSPAEVERLLASAIRRARALGKTDRVILIGQSFGADMIPVGLSLLPPDLRSKIVMVGLVVPTDTLFLQTSLSELFNWRAPDADALPTARMLDWVPVTCISGRKETTSLCPHMTTANVRWTRLPGGHLLDGDADAVHRVLLRAIDRVTQSRETTRLASGREPIDARGRPVGEYDVHKRKLVIVAKRLLVLAGGIALCGAAPDPHTILGLWVNPHGTVKIQAVSCEDKICGRIVWASNEAIRDARDGGTDNLVGTQILRDYRQVTPGVWQGQVFVPDMNDTFYSRIRAVGRDQIKVSGCILHGLLCKSQTWHRA